MNDQTLLTVRMNSPPPVLPGPSPNVTVSPAATIGAAEADCPPARSATPTTAAATVLNDIPLSLHAANVRAHGSREQCARRAQPWRARAGSCGGPPSIRD